MTLVTEKEAAEKWCPYSRVIAGVKRGDTMRLPPDGPAPHNRVQVATEEHDEATWHRAMNCIGSRCMAWRVAEPAKTETQYHCVFTDYEATPVTQERTVEHPSRGYCGAFGKVEP